MLSSMFSQLAHAKVQPIAICRASTNHERAQSSRCASTSAPSAAAAALISSALIVSWGVCAEPALARIPTESLQYRATTGQSQEAALQQLGSRSYILSNRPPAPQIVAAGDAPAPSQQQQYTSAVGRPQCTLETSSSTAGAEQSSNRGLRAKQALACLEAARTAMDQGQYSDALRLYSYMEGEYPDLALAEYARVGHAMLLYQGGQTSDAILALEDEAFRMVGSAEIHAALAALLYTERPSLAFRAEEEWEIASSFDKRYTDLEFVRTAKHWPVRMVAALQSFLELKR